MRGFICSEHFDDTCFDDQGRHVSVSVPTFFPQRSSKDHDHSYSGCANTLGDSVVDDEGRVFSLYEAQTSSLSDTRDSFFLTIHASMFRRQIQRLYIVQITI